MSSPRASRSAGKPALPQATAGTEAAAANDEARPLPICGRVIQLYLPLVYQIAGQLARRLPCNVLKGDLISAGVFGLVDSLRRNGGDVGERFEWYARTRIRGAIVDELRSQDWLSRRQRAACRAREDDDARAMLVSLSDITSVEESFYLAANERDPAETVALRSEIGALARAVEQLPERERRIVAMHYFDGMKFKDIGLELGVSEPRISQLHARALHRLRWLLRAA